MFSLPEVQFGSTELLYNIGVVSRMTGLTMATLRAWERRYHFPEARRTEGGHRLYSERDIYRLRWIKDRIDDGMQTAQAINALKHQEESSKVFGTNQSIDVLGTVKVKNQSCYQEIHKRLFETLKNANTKIADEIIAEAAAIISIENLILKVFNPLMASIGESWSKGELSIASEHLSTNYLRQKLIMWMLSGPIPQTIRPIMLACAPNEWHEGSLLILGSLLRWRRLPVVYLGQNLPIKELLKLIKDTKPKLVVLVSMTEESAINLIELPKLLAETENSAESIISYGGRIFIDKPEWREKISGIYLGNTIEEGLSTIDMLVKKDNYIILNK